MNKAVRNKELFLRYLENKQKLLEELKLSFVLIVDTI